MAYYKTQIKNVGAGYAVDSFGRRLTFIGNYPCNAGDYVWTDGNVIFGHIANYPQPVIFDNEQQSGIPVVGYTYNEADDEVKELRGYFDSHGNFKKYNVFNNSWFVNDSRHFKHGNPEDTNGYIDAEVSYSGELLTAKVNGDENGSNSITLKKKGETFSEISLPKLIQDAGYDLSRAYDFRVPYFKFKQNGEWFGVLNFTVATEERTFKSPNVTPYTIANYGETEEIIDTFYIEYVPPGSDKEPPTYTDLINKIGNAGTKLDDAIIDFSGLPFLELIHSSADEKLQKITKEHGITFQNNTISSTGYLNGTVRELTDTETGEKKLFYYIPVYIEKLDIRAVKTEPYKETYSYVLEKSVSIAFQSDGSFKVFSDYTPAPPTFAYNVWSSGTSAPAVADWAMAYPAGGATLNIGVGGEYATFVKSETWVYIWYNTEPIIPLESAHVHKEIINVPVQDNFYVKTGDNPTLFYSDTAVIELNKFIQHDGDDVSAFSVNSAVSLGKDSYLVYAGGLFKIQDGKISLITNGINNYRLRKLKNISKSRR